MVSDQYFVDWCIFDADWWNCVPAKNLSSEPKVRQSELEFASLLFDKRINRRKLYSSKDIVFITIAAVVCGAQNLSAVFKTALAMMKEYPSKRSIATKRKRAGWSNKVLFDILTG